ncbi:MAG: PQQ-dependent sugar dehydrogenase [Sphingosinicella sp.]|uniref:PQQ-dependent sugar dehydrogenase n=1 Tax=Sphingosinicella sp. TaxID=1917971 RepID=UPI004037E1B9
MHRFRSLAFPFLALIGCTAASDAGNAGQGSGGEAAARPFAVEEIASFDEPWAMTFLPGGRQALITEKRGVLKLWTVGAGTIDVGGVPAVDYGGQGGLGDVVLAPDFATSNMIYLSFAEVGDGGMRGAAVGRGRLVVADGAARLENFQVIWRQVPKFDGRGHYAHRIVFSPDGRHLFISSGDRQEFDPAQDMNSSAGKVLRLNPDGSVPADNPFASRGGVTAQIWSSGHRNPLGLAFAPDGRLWEHEMGPRGGDEFNLIERGSNYGYPTVSNGDHYDGRPIPDHDTRPEFNAPEITWTPVISPSSLIFYTGAMFPQWRGSALIGGLSGQALVRVTIDGNSAREAERFAMGQRIREVEQHPDGSVYLLEDERNGSGGRLLRLTPAP